MKAPDRNRRIFKLLRADEWAAFQRDGRFEGAPVDLADGYVHMSEQDQIRETAARHFAGEDDLTLALMEEDAMGVALKWEASRGGALFPHLYAPLLMSHVLQTWPLKLGPDGAHDFPADAGVPNA